MRKLRLSDWASIAEIVGTMGVIASLLFVVVSLERNTAAVSSQAADQIYEANRQINLVELQNPDLLEIISRGGVDSGSLSETERLQYVSWLAFNLDLWEQIIIRQDEGVLQSETIRGWDEYFREFVKRNLSQADWAKIKWWYPVDEDSVHLSMASRIESILAEKAR